METDLSIYTGSPYLPEPQKERVDMSLVRSTLIFCITLFISMSMYVFFKFYEDRFVFIAKDKSVFVFDRRTEKGSQCTDGKCEPISFKFGAPSVELFPQGFGGPGIVIPKSVSVPYEGATPPKANTPAASGASYYVVPGLPYNDGNPASHNKESHSPAPSQQPDNQPQMAYHAEQNQAPSSAPASALPGTTVTPPTATVTPPPIPSSFNPQQPDQPREMPQDYMQGSVQGGAPQGSDFDMPPSGPRIGG